jgi:hypothetical protein
MEPRELFESTRKNQTKRERRFEGGEKRSPRAAEGGNAARYSGTSPPDNCAEGRKDRERRLKTRVSNRAVLTLQKKK